MKETNYRTLKLLPECINPGCGSFVHTSRVNKNKTYVIRAECYKCHNGGRNRPGVTQHKKIYCENKDGRLDFICSSTSFRGLWQLEMDHKDGNRWNNVPENVQTLCRNCHADKTKHNGDCKNNKPSLSNFDLDKIQSPLTMNYTK